MILNHPVTNKLILEISEVTSTYYYRLKQQDTDGKTTLSKTIAINTSGNKNAKPILSPNPVNTVLSIDWSKTSLPISVGIVNLQGQTLLNQAISSEKTTIDVRSLPNGLYNMVYRKKWRDYGCAVCKTIKKKLLEGAF